MNNCLEQLTELEPIKPDIEKKIKHIPDLKVFMFDIYGTLLISSSGDIGSNEMHSKTVVNIIKNLEIEFEHDIDVYTLGGVIINEYTSIIKEIHKQLKRGGIDYPEVNIIDVWKICIKNLSEFGLIRIKEDFDYKKLALLFELYTNPVWPMPKMKYVLKSLLQKGYKLGVISNSQFYTPIIMNYFLDNKDLNDSKKIKYFEENLMFYSHEHKCAKPAKEFFEQAAQVLNDEYKIQPDSVLFIGNDMLKDIYGAAQVGFKTCLYAGDVRSLRLRKNNIFVQKTLPDLVITELEQLLEI